MFYNKLHNKIYLIIVIIFVFLFFSRTILLSNNDLGIQSGKVYSLNKNWKLYKNDIFIKNIELPEVLELSKNNEGYNIRKKLDNKFDKKQTILIRGSLASVIVYINNENIYNKNLKDTNFNVPMASSWHLVNLPNKSSGKEIKIIFKTPYEAMSGLFNEINYGDRGDLIFYLFRNYGFSLLIGCIIFALGVIMVLFSYMFNKKIYENLLSIGLFAILLSFWLIAESKILQFITNSQLIIGSLAYVSLSTGPIPLIFYIKNNIIENRNRLFNSLITLFSINTVFIITCQFTNISDFFQTLFITLSLIFISSILIIFQLIKEIINNDNKEVKYFFKCIIVLLFFIMIEIVRVFILGADNVTFFVIIGLLVFILMLIKGIICQVVKMIKKSYKAEFYEKLAFKDKLTNANNRMAFEKHLDNLFNKNPNLKDLRLVILDINNLKVINDYYGHVTGDRVIKKSYNFIEKCFGRLGKCYRIGGDEFACIIERDVKIKFEEISKKFKTHVLNENIKSDYPFGIAFGSVLYNKKLDFTSEKMIHRADIEMYKEKSIQKNEEPILIRDNNIK